MSSFPCGINTSRAEKLDAPASGVLKGGNLGGAERRSQDSVMIVRSWIKRRSWRSWGAVVVGGFLWSTFLPTSARSEPPTPGPTQVAGLSADREIVVTLGSRAAEPDPALKSPSEDERPQAALVVSPYPIIHQRNGGAVVRVFRPGGEGGLVTRLLVRVWEVLRNDNGGFRQKGLPQ